MRIRISNVLLVSSLYDLYLFEEEGRLYELNRSEYEGLNLSQSPELTCVSSGKEAMILAREEHRFDLIITTLHIDDMEAIDFARMVKKSGLNIPVVLLMHDNRELKHFIVSHDTSIFDKIFIWQGDFRIIIAIIKFLEDRLNVEHDTQTVGVQSIIVIEDNVKYYSSFLPIIYTEILKQSQRLISEGIDLGHKFLRMRASPKILLCSTYEEAWMYYKRFKKFLLGIISDVDFPRRGTQDPQAGIDFAKAVKKEKPDLPILLFSNVQENRQLAEESGASFVMKGSPLLLQELQQFMVYHFSFGDFIFRMPDGTEVGRASDMKSLEEMLRVVPEECVRYHADRNHFSSWLKARTEFWLADKIRPRKVTDFPTLEGLRKDLVRSLHHYRNLCQRGIVASFSKETFGIDTNFARIGTGSLGGKARGLGFVDMLLSDYNVRNRFKNVDIYVPLAVVLGTDVFDQFLEDNKLRDFAMNCTDDREITKRFLQAEKFPPEVLTDLMSFLELVRKPLAVRSSSMLEDSQYYPFAGVYETYMIPNSNENPSVRLNELLNSIKRVYASTFYQNAKEYICVTSYHFEEEKMAVIIQCLVGKEHENRYYPDMSGVARSYNFYPMSPQKSSDGTASVALGLGKWVVDGGNTVRFCPKYPRDIGQFYSVKETLDTSQKSFFSLALDANSDFGTETHDMLMREHDLNTAEKDGTLQFIGSTYLPENDTICGGLGRNGIRIVTFAPILQNNTVPLAKIIELLLEMGVWGMGTPVEIEFAVNLPASTQKKLEFALLQIRPLVVHHEIEELMIEDIDPSLILCQSSQVLGHGSLEGICDIVAVDSLHFERAASREAAAEIAAFNSLLISEKKPFLLIGIGRWGSLDPWLGIPVTWEQICGAKAIIETGFKDMSVKPSQGSHFFQNITSFMVGYFTIDESLQQGFIDWDWLLSQKPLAEKKYTKLFRFEKPLTVKINGHRGKGVILKPGN
ncbi:MAG: histidine kinase [Bacteroidetes bacterium]|nr:histidine kinase [Bacteroidota bacterium]